MKRKEKEKNADGDIFTNIFLNTALNFYNNNNK